MLETVSELLGKCGSGDSVLPPTELYNEGWLLRLVLNCLDHQRDLDHEFAFLPGSRWYSEALLASQFLADKRGDGQAESFTHAECRESHKLSEAFSALTIRSGTRMGRS